MQEIVIVGGGASGLVSAIIAARKGKKVTILERNNICGKKILVTGNGRCNYFNEDQNIKHYRSNDTELLKEIITKKNQEKVLQFFKEIGIEPKIKNGYYYPFSNQAVSIQNALLTEIKNLNIEIRNEVEVKKIKKQNDKFIIMTDKENIEANKIIISTGSKSAPKTGSDGSGYKICKELGHTIIEPLPALVQLKGKEKYFKEWNGIRADVAINLYEDNKEIAKEVGEIQLTDYGISGICVMNLSGRVARGLYTGKDEYIKINFLSNLNINTVQECIGFINKRNESMKNRTISELLDGIINYKLLNVLLKNLKNKQWNEISAKDKEKIAEILVELKVNIIGTNSFDKSQVCSGGIPLKEIDVNTMESKLVNGLYIIGELLDCDGDCGGYNLTWAWITGIIAGEEI